MPDMEAMRRGLAANLKLVPDCNVSPWPPDSPTTASLWVGGLDEIDYLQTFQDGGSLGVIVAGATSLQGTARAAYARFDRWLLPGDESVLEAIQSDDRLTSRLLDNGSVQTDQEEACDALQVVEFRGYRPLTLRNNVEVLLGEWLVQIETSVGPSEPPS